MRCLIQSWLTFLKGIPRSNKDECSNDEDQLGLEDPEAHDREYPNLDDHDFGEPDFHFDRADEGNSDLAPHAVCSSSAAMELGRLQIQAGICARTAHLQQRCHCSIRQFATSI